MTYLREQRNSAYTLIEMIISIMLMAILGGLLASIIAVNFKTMGDVSDRKKLVTRGTLAINLFEREVGMLKTPADILVATSSEFKFTDTYGNTLDYVITGNTLTRKLGAGTAMALATPIINTDTEFSYYGANNATTSVKADMRLIKLVLVMDDGGTGISLLSIVYPENIKVVNH